MHEPHPLRQEVYSRSISSNGSGRIDCCAAMLSNEEFEHKQYGALISQLTSFGNVVTQPPSRPKSPERGSKKR